MNTISKKKIQHIRPLIGITFALGMLCACNPGPKYAKPPVQAPIAYKESAPQEFKEGSGWKVAQPGDDKIRGKWWEIYNDRQLNALEEQVQISNQSIIAAEANYRAAAGLVVSAHANLFPTITASPSYTNSRFSSTSRGGVVLGSTTGSTTGATTTGATTTGTTTTGTTTGTTGTTTTSTGTSGVSGVAGVGNAGIINTFSLPFQFSYEVDLWHKVRNTIAQNAFSAQASAGDLATALLSTQAQLAQDYFQVRALDAERKILEDTVTAYQQTLDLTMAQFRGGTASEENVAQAQTQLETAEAQQTDLGVSRAQYEHAIAMLIGRPPANFALEVAPLNANPPAVPVALPSELLERRPDIAAAERRVAAANAGVGIARAAYYPTLSLSATLGLQSSSLAQWFTWPSRFWSLGPQLAQTLFDAGARRGATQQAEAQYDQAVANYRQTVLTAFQAVEDNLASLRILSQEIEQQRKAVQAATHYLDLSLARYKSGVDSYLNVITAQTTVLTNRETQLQIELREMTSSVLLVQALGGGWDVAEFPKTQNMLAKPAKWTPATAPAQKSAQPVAPANPPPLSGTPANQPGESTNPSQNPGPR